MGKARRKGDSVVTGRATGRPRKTDQPRVPYDEVDRVLVFGESVPTEDGHGSAIVFPSYRTLALRYGVSNSVIAAFAKRHKCLKRREVAQARIAAKADEKLVELRAQALALSRDDELRIIDTYLSGFEKALADGVVRFDDPGHFDRLCRLKEFLQGGADSRQEVHAALSLEDLQARHRQMLRQAEGTSAAERGDIERVLPAPAGDGHDAGFKPPTPLPAAGAEEATGRLEVGFAVDGKTGRFPGAHTAPCRPPSARLGHGANGGDRPPHEANVARVGPVSRETGPVARRPRSTREEPEDGA